MSKPAARLTDLTVHGSPLLPGWGSPNVSIGNQPAWRGVSAAQAAQLVQAFKKAGEDIQAAQPTGGERLADTIKSSAQKIADLIDSFKCDKHICPTMYVVIPHGIGVVIDGSQTVLINGLPACRQGDTIQETLSANSIAIGYPTVWIGL